VLERHPLRARVPTAAVLLAAPVPGPLLRLLQRVESLAGEAVVAHRLHRPLDARLISRAAHSRCIDVKTARLGVLEKSGGDARRKRVRRLHDALGIIDDKHAEDAAEELPCCLAGGDRRARRLLEAGVDEAVARAHRSEDPGAEATAFAEQVRLQESHPTGVELHLRARPTVGHRHRGCGASEIQLCDGEAVQRRVRDLDATAQEQPLHLWS